MSEIVSDDQTALEQAIRWFTWLRDNKVDPECMDVFLKWRASSIDNQQAYEKIEELWKNYDSIDVLDLPWPSEVELRHDQYDGSNPLPLPEHKNPLLDDLVDVISQDSGDFILGELKQVDSGRNTSKWWLSAAAVFVILAVGLGFVTPALLDRFEDQRLVYVTAVAKQRVERLEDGSVVTLGGSSEIVVAFNRDQRSITLQKGEAFFEVAKDPTRPFVVNIGDGKVQAIGTSFNINRRQNSVTVSVIEGQVEVSHEIVTQKPNEHEVLRKQLMQGDQLVYDKTTNVWLAGQSTLDRAKFWRDGRLAYINERLDAVLQDVNRYSARKLFIGDAALAELRYTGTFFQAGVEEWLQALQDTFQIKVLELDDRIILLES